MHPVGGDQQPVVIAISAHQLQPHGQTGTSDGKWQMYTRQAQQRPAAAKQRVSGTAQACGRFADAAGGQQHIVGLEQRGHALPRKGSGQQIVGMRLAADAHAVGDQRLQRRA